VFEKGRRGRTSIWSQVESISRYYPRQFAYNYSARRRIPQSSKKIASWIRRERERERERERKRDSGREEGNFDRERWPSDSLVNEGSKGSVYFISVSPLSRGGVILEAVSLPGNETQQAGICWHRYGSRRDRICLDIDIRNLR